MNNQKETIRKMVTYLNNPEKDGGYWLPNIQRSFVWSEEQIERLFDSIMRGYPIGSLLIWKTDLDLLYRYFIVNYHQDLKLSTLFDYSSNKKMKMIVLDGQQRLQSLFIGLKGSYDKKELYFDVLSGILAPPEDIRYKFKFLNSDHDNPPWIKFKDISSSNEKYNQIANRIIKKFKRDLTDDEKQRIQDNIAQIVKVFQTEDNIIYQVIDSIDNPEAYQEDDVVEIFIRANSGGTPLSKSDLLFSLLTTAWEDSHEKMEELLEELNKTGFKFNKDFVLKTCLSLLGRGARYDVKKFRDKNNRIIIVEKWDEISNAIKDVKDFLYGKTYIRCDKALPSYLILIPLIYFRFHFKSRWKEVKNLDDYILRTLISRAFSGSPDSLIDKCTREIEENKDFNVNRIYTIIRANNRSLEISPNTILGQLYTSDTIHLVFNLWYKDFNYFPSFENNIPQIDHIFPQSLLKSIKLSNPTSNVKNIFKYKKDDRDQIANCMLLSKEENSTKEKGDTPPVEWFKDKSDEYLDKHLIPKNKELWKIENFEKFIEERKKLIESKFSYLFIKKDNLFKNQ